ncbi:MAG TPA: Lrp/AsnC family transcriptional regulator [Spirochaetia bacterium]|nr:Lrp/AsnC family transcriptional regulator [Spirochaetia bacterium]
MKVDETNIAIIKQLRDGRRSFKAIADALEITENTVRSRVSRLIENGVLEIAGLVDPSCIAGHRVILIGVRLATVNLVKKGEEFARLRGVISVSVVTGRYDLILQVLVNEEFGILEFYTEEVSRIEEVQSVETFVVYKGFNLKVPYLL